MKLPAARWAAKKWAVLPKVKCIARTKSLTYLDRSSIVMDVNGLSLAKQAAVELPLWKDPAKLLRQGCSRLSLEKEPSLAAALTLLKSVIYILIPRCV